MPQNQPSVTDPATGTLNPSFTAEQNAQLFEIHRQRMEEERAAATADATRKAEFEQRKAEVELECMAKELESRIAAAASKATIPGPSTFRLEEDDILGEVLQEVKNLSARFAGLAQDEIAKIFRNKLKPMNLFGL